MDKLLRSFVVSAVDLFHPRILLLILIPPFFSLVVWMGFAWFFWPEAIGLTQYLIAKLSWMSMFLRWQEGEWLQKMAPLVFALAWIWVILLLFPLVLVTSSVLMTLLAMPGVLRYMEKQLKVELERKKGLGFISGWAKLLFWSVAFMAVWILTLPLWLIQPLGPVVSFFLTMYFQKKIYTLDVLAEFVSREEYKLLTQRYRGELYLLAAVLAGLLLVPLVNLLVPVYGALVFARFLLVRLVEIRNLSQPRPEV